MDVKTCLLMFALGRIASTHDSDGTWSYDGLTGAGPDHWTSHWPLCGGSSQSPIDLPGNPKYDESLTDFRFHGYDSFAADDLIISNVGWSVKVVIKDSSIGKAYFTGGGYHGNYTAAQLHLHWGANNSVGSDHTYRGQHYPAELHIAHFKEEYGNISNALKHIDGATVIAFFFQISEDDNSDLVPFFNALDNVKYKGDSEPFGTGLDKFIADDTSDFYKYHGSFTHPPCLEVITWTVFKHPNSLSQNQLDKLRLLYDGDRDSDDLRFILDNGRPTQPLGGRTVLTSFQVDSSDEDDDDSDSDSIDSNEESGED